MDSPPPSPNSNDVLQLADVFKDIVEEKNAQIKELKKVIMSVYGLVRIACCNDEYEIIDDLRTYLSNYLENEFSYPE